MSSSTFRGQPIKDLRGYMTTDQVKALIAGADPKNPLTPLPKGFQVFLRLLWVCGSRVSEILGDQSWYHSRVYDPVRVKAISFSEGNIVLPLLKRKQYPPPTHLVPLDSVTLEMLKAYIEESNLQKEDPLFNFSRESAFYYLRKLGGKVGIEAVGSKGLHCHHFRHSNCVAYIRDHNTMEGLKKLQERIGHADINTTSFYLQFGLESRKETEDTFGKW